MGKNKKNGKHELSPHAPEGAKELKRYSEPLPVALDDAGLTALREQLTAITCERVLKEAEIAGLREAVKGLKDREDALAGFVSSSSEERNVEVVEYLLPTNEVQTVRMDTGEVLATRAADLDDRQDDLPFIGRELDVGGDGAESPGP